MTSEPPECPNCGHNRFVHPRQGSLDGYRCAGCRCVSTADSSRALTDGGLSESFAEFVNPDSDPDATCGQCGDDVPRRFLVDGLCIGCRESGEGPAASAHIGGVDQGDGLETDGGRDPRTVLRKHAPLWRTGNRNGNQSALHVNQNCTNLGSNPRPVTDPAEIPLRAAVCGLCDPDNHVDFHDGTGDYGDVPAIEDDDPELVTDGGSVEGDREIDVCPNCDSVHFNRRTPGHPMNNIPGNGARYHCSACDTEFDEPSQRPRRVTPELRGSVAELDEMDPDELPRRGDAR